MSLATSAYNVLVKRNSVYVSTIFAGAFAFGVGFDIGVTAFWDRWNQGKQPPHLDLSSYTISPKRKQP